MPGPFDTETDTDIAQYILHGYVDKQHKCQQTITAVVSIFDIHANYSFLFSLL